MMSNISYHDVNAALTGFDPSCPIVAFESMVTIPMTPIDQSKQIYYIGTTEM